MEVLREVSTDFQKTLDSGRKFPLVYVPAPGDDHPAKASLPEVFSIKENKEWLDEQLKQFGALLFRGFEVRSAKDLDLVLESLGWEEFPYIEGGGYAARERVHGSVMTANKYPLHMYIGFHNEAAYLEKSPSRIFFFCKEAPAPGTGGATPIVPGHVVYNKVKENQELADELLNKGPVYLTSVLSEGRWREKYNTDDMLAAQSKAAKERQNVVEWIGEGRMKVSTRALPPLFKPDRAGRMSLFGSLGHIKELNKVADDSKTIYVEFEGGKRVSEKAMDEVVKIMREEEVKFSWEEGDVLMLDNSAVLHSRQPCGSTSRVILVAVTY